jgi:hypothetical protein
MSWTNPDVLGSIYLKDDVFFMMAIIPEAPPTTDCPYIQSRTTGPPAEKNQSMMRKWCHQTEKDLILTVSTSPTQAKWNHSVLHSGFSHATIRP